MIIVPVFYIFSVIFFQLRKLLGKSIQILNKVPTRSNLLPENSTTCEIWSTCAVLKNVHAHIHKTHYRITNTSLFCLKSKKKRFEVIYIVN